MIISMVTDGSREVEDYVADMKDGIGRQQIPFFIMECKKYFVHSKVGLLRLWVFDFQVLMPSFWVVGFVLIPFGILAGHLWIVLGGLGFVMLGYFWSRSFFLMALRKGLEKKGYTGTMIFLTNKKALEALTNGAI